MKPCPVLLLWVALASCASPEGRPDAPPRDAAVLYREVLGRFPKMPPCLEDLFEDKSVKAAEVDSALAAYAPLLEEMGEASRAPRCTWTYARAPCMSEEYPLPNVMTASWSAELRLRLDSDKLRRRCARLVDDALPLQGEDTSRRPPPGA